MRGSVRRSRIVALTAALLAAALLGVEAQEPAGGLARRLLEQPDLRPGLCVHVGCGDGELIAALARSGRYVVHGLTADPDECGRARARIESLGLYGRASVDCVPLDRLPYADDLVNLLIVSAPDTGQGEITRVLAPGGTAFVQEGAAWETFSKPRSAGMDEWTHFEHDAARTGISGDVTAGAPAGIRWLAGESWPLYRTFSDPPVGFASMGGRNFYWVTDPVRPGRRTAASRLTCRDAYNGVLLWELPLKCPSRPTSLIALGDRLYVHLGGRGGLRALDAATGETVLKYEESPDDYWNVILCEGGVLVQSVGSWLGAFDAARGTLLWEKRERRGADSALIAGGRVFYLEQAAQGAPMALVCCDLRSGAEAWRASVGQLEWADLPKHEGLSLISCRDGMLFLGSTYRRAKPLNAANHVLSAEDGRLLWSYEYVPADHGGWATSIFLLRDLVWVKTQAAWVGLDPKGGAERERIADVSNRCYPDHATARWILTGKMDFLDLDEGRSFEFLASRSACGSGFMPANGLVYTYPTRCNCYPMVRGYMGLWPGPVPAAEGASSAPEPERGPAFGRTAAPRSASADDWPTLRHDAQRSGGTPAELPAALRVLWEAQPGGDSLSSPVVADGVVFVASTDEHQLCALDAGSGEVRWRYTAGGRIDSPPTVEAGRALFGAGDGRAYCLDAADGALVWRLRAAPEDRRIVVSEQVESVWPAHGSVLVRDGLACFAAGRHTYVDGGVRFHAVDVKDGTLRWQAHLSRADGSDLCDVPAADERSVTMGARFEFDPATGERLATGTARLLWAPSGLLEDNTALGGMPGADNWRRQWFYGTKEGRDGFWRDAARGWKANLLVFRGDTAFGVRQDFGLLEEEGPAADLAAPERAVTGAEPSKARFASEVFGLCWSAPDKAWTVRMPPPDEVALKALLLAGDSIFVAGAAAGEEGARSVLWVFSAADGKQLGRVELPGPPRFDGMAAAGGRLYVVTDDGRVLCLGR